MAVLGKKRLESSRSEFARFAEGKSEATQARYWRAYNSYWRGEYEKGRTPPDTRGTQRSTKVLGKKRLESSRSEFARFAEGKSEATKARYWRAYNSYWRGEYEKGRTPPDTRGTQRSTKYDVRPITYERDTSGLAVSQRSGGNRYAVVSEVKYKLDGKVHTATFAIHKGNTRLDDADIREITAGMKDRYKVEGVVDISVLQVVDRLNRVRVPYEG